MHDMRYEPMNRCGPRSARPGRSNPAYLALSLFTIPLLAALLLPGTAQAQNRTDPAEVHGSIAGERHAFYMNGEIVPGGPPDHSGTLWDNAAVTGWWSGPEQGYINLDWGRLPDNSHYLPGHVIDGFMFKYATNNMESQGENFLVYFFDACTGWGNLGIQQAGFLFTGLPNGYALPTLPPGSTWIWNMTHDLEGTGYEFLLDYDIGIGLSRFNQPTMGSTGLALGDRPQSGGNGQTGTENFYDIYYPNGTYNGTWFFGPTSWATWPCRIYGHEGLAAGMEYPYGVAAQGNDAELYCTGSFAHGETTRFLLKSYNMSLQGNLAASLSTMNTYYSGAMDVTRLVGGFFGGSPWTMSPAHIGEFWVYDLDIPPNAPGDITVYFQGLLSDPPLSVPPMDASNGLRGYLPGLPPPPDVWFEEDKIWKPGYTGDELFGWAVDMEGFYAVAGAPVRNGQGYGAAYVFEKSGSTWYHVATLTPSDSSHGDRFGESIAISGDYVIVGAPTSPSVGGAGAAYIFEKPITGWATTNLENAKLTAWDAQATDYFGTSVDVDITTAVVGSPGDKNDFGSYSSGAAYVFVRESGSWNDKSKLIASDRDPLVADTLGTAVAVSFDYVIAGNPYDDDNGEDAGAAYIFEKPGSWPYHTALTETAKVTAAGQGASESDWFGSAVAIEYGTAVVGSPNDDEYPNRYGSVHVFERIGGYWTIVPVARLIARNPVVDASLGCSVAISGEWIAAGAYYDHGNVNRAGAAYFYKKPLTGWRNAVETDVVAASDGSAYDAFGRSVSIDVDYALVGADLDDDPGLGSYTPSSAGSAYVFYLDE